MVSLLQKLFSYLLIQFIFKMTASLGVGIVSYKFLTDFFNDMRARFASEFFSSSTTVLAFLDLGGFVSGLEFLFAGLSFVISYVSLTAGFRLFKL